MKDVKSDLQENCRHAFCLTECCAHGPSRFSFLSSVSFHFRSLVFPILLCLVLLMLPSCGVSSYGARRVQERKPVYHIVQRGEKIQNICQRYGVKQENVLRLNSMRNPEKLIVGQRLLVGYKYPQAEARENIQRASYRPGKTTNVAPFVTKGYLGWPVSVGRIASTFGPRNEGFHDGIDFAAPSGTPVFAVHRGRVLYADNELSGYGNLVIIKGDDRLTTIYGHNSEILVREGQLVEKGREIATVGSTGRSNGPHLHFEVRAQDSKGRYVAIDPWPLLTEPKDKINPRYRVNESLTPLITRLFR